MYDLSFIKLYLVSKYYSVTQFNDDGKITTALEWFDVGGVFDQLESQLQN